ncbi:MAG TPA: YegP family protein [Candidatus Limnocylindrales bacterium]|nr:YegP family protein [Candidatus Limnocylindrales bacterium]
MRNSSLITLALASVLAFSTFTGCATTGDANDGYGEEDGEATGIGKLSLWQSTDGQWRFNLKSGNGGILLTSEAYVARTGAINGMLSVLENGVDPAQYEVVPAKNGYVVHLTAGNHETISFSQTYSTKSSATRAVKSCVNATTTYLDRREADFAGARFEVQATDSGAYHFNVHAKNGQVVLSSESYTTEAAAYNGAFAVQKDGQAATSYTIKENAQAGFYFTLSALNGEVIGMSQQYTTRQAAADGIKSLQTLLPTLAPL